LIVLGLLGRHSGTMVERPLEPPDGLAVHIGEPAPNDAADGELPGGAQIYELASSPPFGSLRSCQTVRDAIARTQPLTWVFCGDAIASGADWDRRTFVEIFAARVRRRRPLDTVINTTVAGETAAHLLDGLELRSLRFRPDVVVVTLGAAEPLAAEAPDGELFQDQLQQLVMCIRAAGALPVLQTPNRVRCDRIAGLLTRLEAIYEVASELNVPCVDHWNGWSLAEAQGTDLSAWLTADGIHPNGEGHRQCARLICTQFGVDDAKTQPRVARRLQQ
jgi:lysophospholipase L1-like esterase